MADVLLGQRTPQPDPPGLLIALVPHRMTAGRDPVDGKDIPVFSPVSWGGQSPGLTSDSREGSQPTHHTSQLATLQLQPHQEEQRLELCGLLQASHISPDPQHPPLLAFPRALPALIFKNYRDSPTSKLWNLSFSTYTGPTTTQSLKSIRISLSKGKPPTLLV